MRRPAPLPPPLSAVLLVLAVATSASAQPVSFQLKNDVPAGRKPELSLTAVERVKDVTLSLVRDDGLRFEERLASLSPGQTALLPIGDGAAGRAHYTGRIALVAGGGEPWSYELAFDTLVRAGMTLRYDLEHLDLATRTLRFQASRPAGSAEVEVIGEDGRVIGSGSARYHGEPANSWLAVRWDEAPGAAGARVLAIRLHAVARDGLGARVELVPWSVDIPHEDVTFDTDKAEIRPSETAKLDRSLARIEETARRVAPFVRVELYVAGHTDTVGDRAKNQALSLERARAIARYFRDRLGDQAPAAGRDPSRAIPIAYAGFGEDALKVKTGDNVDEPQNRRADYVLGALDSPPRTGARAEWKRLP